MSNINIPSLTINGKLVRAKNPKISLWRKISKLSKGDIDFNTDEGIDVLVDILALTFDVSAQEIEDNVELADFMNIFTEISVWLEHVMTSDKILKNV